MSLVDNLQKNVMGFGLLIMLIVILSLVLLNFKTTGVACPSGYVYNSTSDLCGTTANQSVTLDPGTVFNTIDTTVTAFQEPGNWVQIVIIALIGVGIIGLFVYMFKKKAGGSGGF